MQVQIDEQQCTTPLSDTRICANPAGFGPNQKMENGTNSFLFRCFVSTRAYAEIGNGASEGYELMVKSAQSQATAHVAK